MRCSSVQWIPSGFTMEPVVSPPAIIDLEDLGFDRGAHLLIDRALSALPVGGRLEVRGRDPALGIHLRAWARARGHPVDQSAAASATLVRGDADRARWHAAERAGGVAPAEIVARPGPTWGLAARGALVEAGGPALHFDIEEKNLVWADLAPRLYAQAAANQWDPATAVDWATPFE